MSERKIWRFKIFILTLCSIFIIDLLEMRITSIVHEVVAKQMDTTAIKKMFEDVYPNVGVVFVCTNENWRKEDYWIDRKDGTIYYKIRIPFEEVLAIEDATPLMLKILNDRLGEIPPGSKRPRKPFNRLQRAASAAAE